MPEDVITRDLSSGRLHRRSADGRTHEADNLDDAGEYEVVGSDVLANVEPGQLCERCFPPIGDDEDAA